MWLFILPPMIGYVIYKLWSYDWEQWAKDCENMGDESDDDFLKYWNPNDKSS